MIESSAYEVLEEMGAVARTKKNIFLLGRAKFGAPSLEHTFRLEGIENLFRLERVLVRILEADDWDDLLRMRHLRTRG